MGFDRAICLNYKNTRRKNQRMHRHTQLMYELMITLLSHTKQSQAKHKKKRVETHIVLVVINFSLFNHKCVQKC